MLRPIPSNGRALPVLPPLVRRIPVASPPHTRRLAVRLAVPVAVALLAAGLTLVAVGGSSQAQLHVAMNVRTIADPQQIGATTQAQVNLVNQGGTEIRPRFSLSWLPYPYYWRVVSGPPVLAPGQRATYEIEAADSVAAPPDGQAFQIHVNDANSIVSNVSVTLQTAKPDLAVVNPRLRMWTQRDPATGVLSPVGWQLYQHKGAGDIASIQPAPIAGVDATHFHVAQDGESDPDGWAHEGLIQQVPFPQRPFELRAYSDAPYRTNSTGWPLTAFGLEISDPHNGLIWILFQQTGNGDREYDLANGQHIIVYDIPINEWSARTIDLPAIYHKLNWAPPTQLLIDLFMGVASGEQTTLDGYIAGLNDIGQGVKSVP